MVLFLLIFAVLLRSTAQQTCSTVLFEALVSQGCRLDYESQVLPIYAATVNCSCPTHGPPPPSPPPEPSSNSSDKTRTLIILVVVLPTAFVLALLLLLFRELRLRTGRTLFGRVKAPAAGDDTTLVVSDIEGSTQLWEQVDESIMDSAISLHHACFRHLIPRYTGYEAQVEGDSFVTAFHNVRDATLFTIAIQAELLRLPWPEELLTREICQPVYAARVPKAPAPPPPPAPPPTADLAPLPPAPGSPHPPSPGGPGQGVPGRANPIPASNDSMADHIAATYGSVVPHFSSVNMSVPGMGYHALNYRSTGEPGTHALIGAGSVGEVSGLQGLLPSGIHLEIRPEGPISPSRLQTLGVTQQSRPSGQAAGASVLQAGLAVQSNTLTRAFSSLPASGGSISFGAVGMQAGDRASVPGRLSRSATLEPVGSRPEAAGDSALHKLAAPLLNATAKALSATLGLMRIRHVARPLRNMIGGMQGEVVDADVGSTNQKLQGGVGQTSSVVRMPSASAVADGLQQAILSSALTVGESLCMKWHVVAADHPGATLIFRGLRVRMGIHTGLKPGDCQFNTAANRMHYLGQGLLTTKAVCDAAAGGMVLASGRSHERLFLESVEDTDKMMTLHMGEYLLSPALPVLALHQILPRPLMSRLQLLPPLRAQRQHSLGVLEAPAGLVTVVFMHVVGEKTLMSWNRLVANEALALYQDRISALLHKHNGYLVELVEGFVLAAFGRAPSALRWVLQCMQEMPRLPWPDELLAHELGEEMVTSVVDDITGVAHEVVAMRGLRLKAGLDCGRLRGEVNCITGRMTYRGRYMNRAARIVAAAGTGQVLASADVWSRCQHTPTGTQTQARSMGLFRLRGVAEPVEVFHLKGRHDVVTTRRASLMLSRDSHSSACLPDSGDKDAARTLYNNPIRRSRRMSAERLVPGSGSSALFRRSAGHPPMLLRHSNSRTNSVTTSHPSRGQSFRDGVMAATRRSLLMLMHGGGSASIASHASSHRHSPSKRSSMASYRRSSSGGSAMQEHPSHNLSSMPTMAGIAGGPGSLHYTGRASISQDLRGYSVNLLDLVESQDVPTPSMPTSHLPFHHQRAGMVAKRQSGGGAQPSGEAAHSEYSERVMGGETLLLVGTLDGPSRPSRATPQRLRSHERTSAHSLVQECVEETSQEGDDSDPGAPSPLLSGGAQLIADTHGNNLVHVPAAALPPSRTLTRTTSGLRPSLQSVSKFPSVDPAHVPPQGSAGSPPDISRGTAQLAPSPVRIGVTAHKATEAGGVSLTLAPTTKGTATADPAAASASVDVEIPRAITKQLSDPQINSYLPLQQPGSVPAASARAVQPQVLVPTSWHQAQSKLSGLRVTLEEPPASSSHGLQRTPTDEGHAAGSQAQGKHRKSLLLSGAAVLRATLFGRDSSSKGLSSLGSKEDAHYQLSARGASSTAASADIHHRFGGAAIAGTSSKSFSAMVRVPWKHSHLDTASASHSPISIPTSPAGTAGSNQLFKGTGRERSVGGGLGAGSASGGGSRNARGVGGIWTSSPLTSLLGHSNRRLSQPASARGGASGTNQTVGTSPSASASQLPSFDDELDDGNLLIVHGDDTDEEEGGEVGLHVGFVGDAHRGYPSSAPLAPPPLVLRPAHSHCHGAVADTASPTSISPAAGAGAEQPGASVPQPVLGPTTLGIAAAAAGAAAALPSPRGAVRAPPCRSSRLGMASGSASLGNAETSPWGRGAGGGGGGGGGGPPGCSGAQAHHAHVASRGHGGVAGLGAAWSVSSDLGGRLSAPQPRGSPVEPVDPLPVKSVTIPQQPVGVGPGGVECLFNEYSQAGSSAVRTSATLSLRGTGLQARLSRSTGAMHVSAHYEGEEGGSQQQGQGEG